jgi:HEAT repeat protein
MSMTALRALVAIDAERAAVIAMPLIAEQWDWAHVRLGLMFRQANQYLQQALLLYAEQQVLESPPHLLRMLRLFVVLPQNRPLPLVGKLSASTELEPEMLSVCLRLVSHPTELAWVRTCFGDRRSSVQVQIAGILARMGTPQDAHYLLFLLDSESWWVRYRAAQALLQQPFINRQAVKRLINNRTDVFARDMLLQIVAENNRC